jgi:hypothetical protein
MPSLQDVEDAIHSVENYIGQQIPIIVQSFHRLAEDLGRFGPPSLPPLPAIPLPSVGPFISVPPPPPPPPPVPQSLSERVEEWVLKHKLAVLGLGTVAGVGLASSYLFYANAVNRAAVAGKAKQADKKDVVGKIGLR